MEPALEKLEQEAEVVIAEGWKWVTVTPEFNYAIASGMRRVHPEPVILSDEQQAELEALEADYETLSIRHESEDVSDEVEVEFQRIDAAIAALRGEERFRPEDIAVSGAFVSLGFDGEVRIERGFVRPEDEPHRRRLNLGNNSTIFVNDGTGDIINGGGSDHYNFASTFGQDTINNGTGSTANGSIAFDTGVTDEKLWFKKSGNDLLIDLLGTTDQIKVAGWYTGAGKQVQAIDAGGLTLDTQIAQLVTAMATYQTAHSSFNP